MKLYTLPGVCSTACHIVLQWSGLPFQIKLMTLETMRAPEYLAMNPAGKVPVLTDDDFVLTQNIAIVHYVADHAPQAMLLGNGSPRQRALALRWLAFFISDLQPAFDPLFAPSVFLPDASLHDSLRQTACARLRKLFALVDAQLEGKEWLTGYRSAADAYLYLTACWTDRFRIDLTGFTHLAAFKQRMAADPGVRAAFAAEGLL
jgi:glutathione S-transferase